MRVLVCGGRDFADPGAMHRTVNPLFTSSARSDFVIIQGGGSSGADRLAREWAGEHGVRLLTFDGAAIITDGKPDLVLAFPGDRGTADLVQRAEMAGVRVVRVLPAPARALQAKVGQHG